MSTPVNNNQTAAAQQIPVPTFLEKAGRTVKIIAGIVAAILGIGCMGIGITMAPFAIEFGAGAIATGTALLALASYLIYNGASAPDLSSRDVIPLQSSG